MKTVLLTGVLFACLLPLGLALRPAPQSSAGIDCANVLPHEPVVVFEVRGATPTGRIARTLTVYNDGWMTLAEVSNLFPDGKCDATTVTTSRVRQLASDLRGGGAAVLCDDTRGLDNLPMRTVTFVGGIQDASAHTFSYWVGDGEYGAVDTMLEKVILENFSDS